MTNYKEMNMVLTGLIEDQMSDYPQIIATLSNVSALINMYLKDINWAGFYLMNNGKLLLGPFQGKVACRDIEIGRGVCGTAVKEDKTQLVYDVHQFPGHIACDSASNSEIVVVIHKDDKPFGVLDIDSPLIGRFKDDDKSGLEECVRLLEKELNK